MKRIIAIVVLSILFVVTAAVNLALYKKYKDAIDYFNQDSQLTVGHFKSIEEKMNSAQSIAQSLDSQVRGFDDRIKAIEESAKKADKVDKVAQDLGSAISAQGETNKDILSKIDVINNDILGLRADMGSLKETLNKKKK